MIQPEQIPQIVNAIVEGCDPEKIILFGSFARGNPDKDSDLDFIIVRETDTPRMQRGWEIRKHLLGVHVPLDLKIYTPDEFREHAARQDSFLRQILNESIVLYEKS